MTSRSGLSGPLLSFFGAVLMFTALVGAAAGQATLYIGSDSAGVGEVAALEVLLQTATGTLVSGLQFDLEFDSSRLEVAAVRAGEVADDADKDVVWSTPNPGTARILVIGLNNAAMGQGTLLEVDLRVLSGAPPGSTPVSGRGAVATTPDNQPVLIDVIAGTVRVSAGLLNGCCPWIVPAAAASEGLEGTRWRTDLSLENLSNEPREVGVVFGLSGMDNRGAERQTLSLAAGELVTAFDVVGDLFGLDQVAGALFLDVDTPNLRVTSRTYNLAEDGTYGQGIPAERIDDLLVSGDVGRLFPVAASAVFRSNLGVVNASAVLASVRVVLVDANGITKVEETLDVPPWSHLQVTDLLVTWSVGLGSDDGRVLVEPLTEGCRIGAYLSVVDNRTGDPTYYGVIR